MAEKKLKNGKLLGIDIGLNSVKIAEVVCDSDEMTVTALGEAPMPPDVIVGEEIANPKFLANIIKGLVKDCGCTCKKAVVAITAPQNILVKSIEVPKSDSEKQTKLSVKYEVERLFPHSSYDTEFDYQIISGKSETASNVFVVAGYRKLVEDLLKTIKLSGLELDALEVAELGIGRSLLDPMVVKGEPICGIVDLGAEKSSICVFDQLEVKYPLMAISVTGKSMTKVISEVMGTSIEEAEEFKKDYSMINMDIIKEYYDKKYADDFDFDASTFDTAFDDPNYNPAYSGEQEGDPFASDGENPFEAAEDNPFETTDEELQEEEVAEPEYDGFDLKEENEKLAEEVAAKSGAKFTLDDMEEETDASGKQDTRSAKAADPEKSDDVCRMLCEQLENLQNEIRSQLDEYYNTTGVNVAKLILCGGVSKMPGLDEFLSEYLGIDVMLGNPRDVLKFRMSNTAVNVLEDINSVYPASIGLAMRDFIE